MPERLKFGETKSPEFRSIYTTGVFGGLRPDDAYMILFQDRIQTETEEVTGQQRLSQVTREAQIEVHMSPAQFKKIFLWMQSHITLYEKAFGTIPIEPKKGKTDTSTNLTPTV